MLEDKHMKITPESQKKVDDAVVALLEHFDSVRIFVTAHDGADGVTQDYSSGGGNYYSQYGFVKDWIERQKSHTDKEVKRGKL